jgi:hypothetical protein
MDYQEFLQKIKETVVQQVSGKYQVHLQEVIKNNDQKLNGITIIQKNERIAPTVYLNSYYEEYLHGRSIESIVQELINISSQASNRNMNVIPDIVNYGNVCDCITYRLINRKMNQERLKDMPYMGLEDLAKVYYLELNSASDGFASVAITHVLLKQWNKSLDEINMLADINTPKIFPATIISMEEVMLDIFLNKQQLENMSKEEKENYKQLFLNSRNSFNDTDVKMYILSNKDNRNGASTLLYPDLLHDFASSLHSNLYFLPSSIQEVILIPFQKNLSPIYLRTMVKEVNSEEVAPEEVLSNEIYYYDLEKDEFHIVEEG